VLTVLGAIALLAIFLWRQRGAWVRSVAALALLAALPTRVLLTGDREQLSSVVARDRRPQPEPADGERIKMTDDALAQAEGAPWPASGNSSRAVVDATEPRIPTRTSTRLFAR
jgi:hypothetical protein